MTEKYLFFNSTMEDRRKHQASDIAEYWDSFLSSGLIHTDGKPTLKVKASGEDMKLNIDLGKAIMLGHLYMNTSLLEKEINQATATEDRFDRVVLRLDLSKENRYIKAFIKEGTGEEPPELTREGLIYEVSLAQIHVKAGKNYLEQSDIIDERLDEELCGLASSLVTVPTDVFVKEWQEWFTTQQTEGFVLASEKGAPGGIPILDSTGNIPLNQLNNFKVPKFNYSTTRPPNASDNLSKGFEAGSRWTYNEKPLDAWNEYVCIQSSQSSAIWKKIISNLDVLNYYYSGNENVDVTGGWQETYAEGNYNINRYSNRLRLQCTKVTSLIISAVLLSTGVKVDLSKINTLYIDWENLGSNEGQNQSRFVVSEEKLSSGIVGGVARYQAHYNFGRRANSIDVSSLNGEYYLNIYTQITGTNNHTADLNVYRVWGER